MTTPAATSAARPARVTYHLIASSPTRGGIVKQIQSYFYSPGIFLDREGGINNSTGRLTKFRVTQGKGRYRFERIEQVN